MFHDRPTCARSRSRCSRPERGRPKVPFSWCRCHILVIDNRWGSLGSNETATATTGGPWVIDVFDGNAAPSGPNCTLFVGADRLSGTLWDRSEVGWSPTPHARELGALQRALDRNLWQIMANRGIAPRTMGDVSYSRSGGVGGVGDCTCLVPTQNDFRKASGPPIDRIPPTRPPWWRRQ